MEDSNFPPFLVKFLPQLSIFIGMFIGLLLPVFIVIVQTNPQIVTETKLYKIVGSWSARRYTWYLNRNHVSSDNDEHDITVSELNVYPVKSLRKVAIEVSKLDALGLENDRRLMIVRRTVDMYDVERWRFLTQRQCSSLATIDATVSDDNHLIKLSVENGKKSVDIDISQEKIMQGDKLVAGIWDDKVVVSDISSEDARQFIYNVVEKEVKLDPSLGITEPNDVRLVSILPLSKHQRASDESYMPLAALQGNGSSPNVALSDGYPILIANEASLAELNRKIVAKSKPEIPMSRFRPNIVVKGAKAFEEDEWKAIEIEGNVFHVVKGKN